MVHTEFSQTKEFLFLALALLCFEFLLRISYENCATDAPKSAESGGLLLNGADSSGWELALVTTDSSNSSHLTESKLVCVYIFHL